MAYQKPEKSEKATEKAQGKPADNSAKPNSERAKALDTALAQIERQFGKGSVILSGSFPCEDRMAQPNRAT